MSLPATDARLRRRGLWRWSVALVATILMVVVGSGLVAFAQNGEAAGKGPQFVPAESPIYVEVRLDMPDSQGEALAQFMSAFPGFADTGSFPTKSEEIISMLVEMVTGGEEGFSELAQYMNGEVGLAVTDLSAAMSSGEDPPMLIGVAINDRTAVENLVAGMAMETASAETHGNATIFTEGDTSVAVHDEWVLLAQDAAQVKAAIDTLEGASPSLADDPEFSAAFARVPAGHLGAAYMDIQSFAPLLTMSSIEVGAMPLEGLIAQLPIDMVAYLAAEPDRMNLEAFITPSAEMGALPVGESDLAGRFPADTQLYVETRELGMTLSSALGGLMAMMDEETQAEMAPIESMLGVPLSEFLDFVSDASVGAGLTSDGLWLGVAAEVNDEVVTAERLARVMGIVGLLGASSESGIAVETATVGGAEVTTITLPLEEALGELPVSIGSSISIAVSDGTLLIGLGDFVENALTQPADASLGASEPYVDAVGDDTVNSGIVYANIGSLLAVVDPFLARMIPEWADIRPYATAIDRLVAVGVAGEDVITARLSLIVSQ